MIKPAHVIDIFLQPGDFYFGDENTSIRTILGSCVSITMWHPTRLIGGMCHYMLPSRAGAAADSLDGRYADEALQMFLHEIRAAKTHPAEYRVKLFGAGNMFPDVKKNREHKSDPNVPDKNRAIAYSLIEKHGFKIDAEDLGGDGHRQVLFDIWSGHAWLKKPALTNALPKKVRKSFEKPQQVHRQPEADHAVHLPQAIKKPDFVLEMFLLPGDFYFGDAETSIRTVLGSCVAITMWHPKQLIGGMCHFMLPGGRRTASSGRLNGKYADEAILMFLQEVKRSKTYIEDYEVKIFGGGNMFPGIVKKQNGVDIGDNNVEMAKTLTAHHGFNVIAQDVGKTGHRNVIFDIWSGHVWVKHVSKALQKQSQEQENVK